MARPERIRLLTPTFRVSVPDVFQKRVFQGQGEESGRYACAACYARASVTPFAFNNIGKGIALGLNHLQKLKEGERLDACTSPEDDFGADPAEFRV